MLTGFNVERIKLFSTRSPYWCLAIVLAAGWGFGLLLGLVEHGENATVGRSQTGMQFGLMAFMVLAAIAVTTEYRFGTIRNSFLATPQRWVVLASKTLLIAVLGAVIAAAAGFGAFLLTQATAANPPIPLELMTGKDYRQVFGWAALFAIGGMLAVSIGTLVRQSAAAISILLLWPLLAERLLVLIPGVDDMAPYFPFSAGFSFTMDDMGDGFGSGAGPSPLAGLLIFAGTAVVFWVIALIMLQRRDA